MSSCAHTCHDHSHDVHAVHRLPSEIAARESTMQQQCHARGVRLTPLRLAVFRLILQAEKPIGAYDLLAQLSQKDGRAAAPPTVYRSLDFLLAQGFIHRLASINAYIPCCHPREGHHAAFLICQHCQKVSEAAAPELLSALQQVAMQGQFVVQHTLIEMSGLCMACQAEPPHV